MRRRMLGSEGRKEKERPDTRMTGANGQSRGGAHCKGMIGDDAWGKGTSVVPSSRSAIKSGKGDQIRTRAVTFLFYSPENSRYMPDHDPCSSPDNGFSEERDHFKIGRSLLISIGLP
jgi:hypothetical protein